MSLDSLGKIAQVNSVPGALAGALAQYLDAGTMDWLEQRYDSTFADTDTISHGRAAQNGQAPGLTQATGENMHFLLYPNPTNGNFIAESSGGRLLLLSIDGRVLREYELKRGKQRLQLPPGLAAGVYLVKYRGEEGERVVRLTYQP